MTARDILNVVVQTGGIKIAESGHVYVDWETANTELLLMFRLGLDTELKVDE
jgi:hypothetical protein